MSTEPRPLDRPHFGQRILLINLVLATLMTLLMVVMAWTLSPEQKERLFAETGPFEVTSAWLWVALIFFLPCLFRRLNLEVLAGMGLCAAAAAREWEMHTRFTTDHYSVLKIPFYYREQFTWNEQLLALLILVTTGICAIFLLYRLIQIRPWREPRPWWFFPLLFACGMVVLTKIVDRVPGLLNYFLGIVLDMRVGMTFSTVEEGVEMLLPIFFATFALTLARWIKTHPTAMAAEPA